MSRKKPSLELPFCGVHEAEWKRINSDAVSLFGVVFDDGRCLPCQLRFVDDACHLCRVAYLAHSRLDLLSRRIEFERKYPKLFDDSENNV